MDAKRNLPKRDEVLEYWPVMDLHLVRVLAVTRGRQEYVRTASTGRARYWRSMAAAEAWIAGQAKRD